MLRGPTSYMLLPKRQNPQQTRSCNQELSGPLLCSGPEVEPSVLPFLGPTTPFPAIPCHPTPVIPPSPNRHDFPLLKILFIGHGVSVQVIMMVMGSGVVVGFRHALVSIPSQALHGQTQNMIRMFQRASKKG